MLGTLPVQEQAGILWLPLHRPLCSERVVFATWQDLGLSPMDPGKPPPGNPPPGKPLRANLHRANLSQANTLKKKHFESGCRALRQPGKLTEMFLGNRAPHSGHTMHSSITQECVRLACAGGRDTRQGTFQYYYKGLCVLTRSEVCTSTQDIVTAFWTPHAQDGPLIFQAMLSGKTPSQFVRKPRTSRLLMLSY
jgi:hypothetical protein